MPSLSRLSLSLLPQINYISAFFHHLIITVHLFTRPNHINLPLLIQFLMLSRSKRSLSNEEHFLSYKVTLYIHIIFDCNKSALLVTKHKNIKTFYLIANLPKLSFSKFLSDKKLANKRLSTWNISILKANQLQVVMQNFFFSFFWLVFWAGVISAVGKISAFRPQGP